MKLVILLFLSVFPINLYIERWIKPDFDYSKYSIEGVFKKEPIAEERGFYEVQTFFIYDNIIYLNIYGENDYSYKFPDGEYILKTKNGSKIKIKSKNGFIVDFYVTNQEYFLKNEKVPDDSRIYCEKGYFYAMQYYLYGNKKYRNHCEELSKKFPELAEIFGEYNWGNYYSYYYVYKGNDKYIFLEDYADGTLAGPIFNKQEINNDYYIENCVLYNTSVGEANY